MSAFDQGIYSVEDIAGAILPGSKLYFYTTGTTTPLATYSDQALTTPNANPVVAGADGRFGPIWLQAISYKVVLKTAADVTLVTRDPVRGDIDTGLTALLAASSGSSLVGFLQAGTAAVARTAQAKMRDMVSVLDFGADPTGVADSTAAIAAALLAHDRIYFPTGTYLCSINLSGKSSKTLTGAGRGSTILKNFNATPVLTFNNTSAPCQQNTISNLQITNRNEATYPNTDGIVFTGADTNQLEFNVFENLLIQDFRYGISIASRVIWTSFTDVHCLSCVDGLHVDTVYNVSQVKFTTCRFGSSTGYGVYWSQTLGLLTSSGIHFDVCTFEQNALNGFRGTGTGGFSGLRFTGCYAETNASSIAAASASPRKANIFIDAAYSIGVSIDACALYGNASSALDWNVYVATPTAGSGFIGANRTGTATNGFASLPSNWIVGPRDGGSNTLTLAAGSVDLTTVPSESASAITLTLTGCTTSPSGTARFVQQGKLVTLYIPAITATSNTTAASLTGLPAGLWPARAQTVLCIVQDNGTRTTGLLTFGTGGAMDFGKDVGGAVFTNSGTKGVQLQTITYSLD